MADDNVAQISFVSANIEELSLTNGAVIISKREKEKAYADLFVDLENSRWKIRPEYTWNEFRSDFEKELGETVNKTIQDTVSSLVLKYFTIERTTEGSDITLNIWATGDDGTTVITDDDGKVLTTDTLSNQISTGSLNGTLSVSGKDVPVKGLQSAAYTESEDYSPMISSNWTDL